MVRKYKLEDGFFVSNDGKARVINTITEFSSNLWLEKQKTSVEEYKITHTESGIDFKTKDIYKLFNAWINNFIFLTYGDSPINVLDVGCGIWKDIPPYIKETKKSITFVGLDPEIINPPREFLFINGMIEDLHKYLHETVKFDVFLFSTSLDHIENIEYCADSLRKVAAQPSYCIFFLGLHDVKFVAEKKGADIFGYVCQDSEIGKMFVRSVKCAIQCMLYFKIMIMRNKKMRKKIPLDNKHFHYFTLENVCDYMNNFGEIVDRLIIPGSNVIFITVKMHSI